MKDRHGVYARRCVLVCGILRSTYVDRSVARFITSRHPGNVALSYMETEQHAARNVCYKMFTAGSSQSLFRTEPIRQAVSVSLLFYLFIYYYSASCITMK